MLADISINRTNPTFFERTMQKFYSIVSIPGRKNLNRFMQQNILQKNFSIIASFCGGGTIYHDLNMKFLSPTINLAFDGEDFCTFCENLQSNCTKTIEQLETDKVMYPVGIINNDIEIRFVHYKTFNEAKYKWEERAKRINFQKILIMATDRDGMGTIKCLERFNDLPYHKIMFTSHKYSYDWAVYCPCFAGKANVGVMTGIADIEGHRFYEKYIDIVNVLNSL